MSKDPYTEDIIRLEKIKNQYQELIEYDYEDLEEDEKKVVDNVNIDYVLEQISELYSDLKIWEAKRDWGDKWEDYV